MWGSGSSPKEEIHATPARRRPRRRRAALLRAASSSGRMSSTDCRGESLQQGERWIPVPPCGSAATGVRELRSGGPRELHCGGPLLGVTREGLRSGGREGGRERGYVEREGLGRVRRRERGVTMGRGLRWEGSREGEGRCYGEGSRGIGEMK